jgi:hypothetical protein
MKKAHAYSAVLQGVTKKKPAIEAGWWGIAGGRVPRLRNLTGAGIPLVVLRVVALLSMHDERKSYSGFH